MRHRPSGVPAFASIARSKLRCEFATRLRGPLHGGVGWCGLALVSHSILFLHLLWHFPLIHAITKDMQEPFYKNGLKFTCKRCSFCCGHSPGFVYLSKSDLERLCAYFKMTAPDFAQKYCRWANYYHGDTVLALQEQKNYDCILWKDGCTAYQARPLQCSTYPFWSWMVKDQATWNEVAQDCPGMNSGQLWPKDYIDKTSTAYDQNTPVTKEQFDTLYSA